MARAISVELKPGDVNLQALTEVQQNAGHLNQCMAEYIRFVLCHWDELKERLKPRFIDLRGKAQTGGHGRLAECAAHLQLGIMTMCEWLASAGVLTAEQGAEIQKKAWLVFMELAEQQNRRIVEEMPTKLFLDALREMLDSRQVKVFRLDSPEATHDYSTDGYRDDDLFYFYPGKLYAKVLDFYVKQGKTFPLGQSALFRQLEIDGVILADRDQRTRVKRLPNGKRSRFLWVLSDKLEKRRE